jgi:hypothetical protein
MLQQLIDYLNLQNKVRQRCREHRKVGAIEVSLMCKLCMLLLCNASLLAVSWSDDAGSHWRILKAPEF